MLANVFSVMAGVGATAAVATSVTDDHISFTQLIVGGVLAVVGGTVAVMTWIDGRMDSKVKASEKRVLAQISHLKDLLVERGVIHSHPSYPEE
jgi:heme O synthase-like polyprenyltransferase